MGVNEIKFYQLNESTTLPRGALAGWASRRRKMNNAAAEEGGAIWAAASGGGSLSSNSFTNGVIILVSVALKVLDKFPIDVMLGMRSSESACSIIFKNCSTTAFATCAVGLNAERLSSAFCSATTESYTCYALQWSQKQDDLPIALLYCSEQNDPGILDDVQPTPTQPKLPQSALSCVLLSRP
ncbi:hypothetical protein Leryth_004395 [Lithospermum erythrorhizon]|nr:hypothetical protein Leryth_004395 [Lithospermum erythrorhizon]